jgi:hypothetical protein
MRAIRMIAGVGIAVALAAATIGLALAHTTGFSRIVTRSKTDSVANPGGKASATVGCPGGKRRVSGGFATNVEPVDGPIMLRSQGGRRAWRAGARVFALIGENYRVTSFVYCARHAPHESTEKDSATIAHGERKRAIAVCPRGTRVISGGFVTAFDGVPYQGNIIDTSRRIGSRKWVTVAGHTSNGPPEELTSIAYCGDSPRLSEASKTTRVDDTTPVAPATATCPRGTRAVSGGFKSKALPDTTFTAAALPRASKLSGKRGWKAVGVQPGVGGTGLSFDWTAYAYCAAAG